MSGSGSKLWVAAWALVALAALAGCRSEKPAADAGRPDAARAVVDAAVDAAPVAAAAPTKPPPGPEVCADCHPDQTFGFLETGMGRSLYRPTARPPIEDFTPEKATVTHPHSGLRYRAYVDADGRWWQEETMPGTDYRRALEVQWVVGSGNHTRSYLGVVEGEVVELPLTWYSRRRIWDMSPGYEGPKHFRFDRPVKPICLFCHNDLTPAVDETLAGYATPLAEGITCGRCHGDGTAHVAARLAGTAPPAGQPDPSILNPARLSPVRQLRVCQQCHLTGEDRVILTGRRWDTYDPRTPLEDHLSIFVYAQDGGPDFGIASHGHRLSLSKCFTASGGALACTKCHDPHHTSDARSQRAACLGCHQPQDCGSAHGTAPDAACAECHMRKGGTSDIPHVTFTDHFIRKDPRPEETPARPHTTELVDALAETREGDDPRDAAVRLGMAHARIWRFHGKPEHLPIAEKKLTAALAARPERADAWEELGHVRAGLGDLVGARAAYAEVEERDPKAVLYRLEQSEVLEALGEVAAAEAALRDAVTKQPKNRKAWGNLANLLQRAGRFDDAEAAYATAEALAPEAAVTANNRGHNAIQRGDLEAAARWFAEAKRRDGADAMAPFNQGTLALRQGDKAGALTRFEEAMKLDPKFPLPYWIRGRMRLAAGDLAAAEVDLTRYSELDPKNPNGWIDLARVHQKRGETSGAIDTLLRGRFHLPRHPAIEQALEIVSAGRPL
ncbi:MAG: tetratricopeptide repeat protein [bacterium]